MKNDLPNSIEKRDLLYGKHKKDPDYNYYGELYYSENRLNEALEFFVKGENEEKVEEIKTTAIKEGDAFLLSEVVRLKPGIVVDADWKKLAANAETTGKESYAEMARKKLEENKE